MSALSPMSPFPFLQSHSIFQFATSQEQWCYPVLLSKCTQLHHFFSPLKCSKLFLICFHLVLLGWAAIAPAVSVLFHISGIIIQAASLCLCLSGGSDGAWNQNSAESRESSSNGISGKWDGIFISALLISGTEVGICVFCFVFGLCLQEGVRAWHEME